MWGMGKKLAYVTRPKDNRGYRNNSTGGMRPSIYWDI